MNKIIFALMALMGLMCNHALAQQCDTVRVFPWNNDFYTDFGCWEQLGDSSSHWLLNVDNEYSFFNSAFITAHNDSAANGCVLVSPALALPADTANMLMAFRTRRVGTAMQLRVLVSTGLRDDLDGYDTLMTVTPSGINSYEVNLSAYAGQTVYVAFSFVKPNQSNDVTFFGVGSVNIISDRMPQGEWFMQNMAARTGDTVEHEFYLTHGIENDSNTLFTWHSTIVDAGQATLVEVVTDMLFDYSTELTLPRSLYRVVYHTPGTDTVTVTASNIFGTTTSQSVSNVYDCAPVSEFPWTMDFGDLNVCWYSEFSVSNNATHGYNDEDGEIYYTDSQLQSQSYEENYLVTNTIAVPADAAHLALTLRWRLGVVEVRAVRVGQETGLWDYVLDTTLFTDLLFNEAGSTILKTRKVNLSAYAGDTIRLAVFHKSSNVMYLMPLSIDYDTLPKIASVQVPSLATVDSAALCTASLRYGPTEGLHFIWHSARGGVFVTNALGDSAWVTYPGGVGDKDTIRVVASNNYGSDTVVRTVNILDCTPQLVLPWKETFANGTACWYKFEGCKFHDAIPYNYSTYEHLRHLYLNTKTDTLGSWIMSKAIAIPADTTLGVMLFWKVASSVNAYQHLYSMLVTTSTDYTDTANYTVLYTDNSTHTNFSNYDTRSVSLAQYAGQTIHIAIHNHGNHLAPSGIGLYLDDIEVRTTTVPVVTLASNAGTYYWGDTANFTATLSEGSPNGLTYTWHSSLLDSTITTSSNILTLNYTIPGTDTVTVIATNAYGSDTDMVVVNSVIITQPEVTLQHTDANVGEPTVYTAVLNHCVTTGLTYTWHSTMLDSTVNSQLSTLNLTYTLQGVDTVTVIATTIYGADTAMAVVDVQNCAPRALPYYENFEGIVATDATTAGNLPDCWNNNWNGSNAAYAPHVITPSGYQYISNLPDNALFMVAGSFTGYGNRAEVVLPRMADSLQHLAIALDYRFENGSYGILTVGYYNEDNTFTAVQNLYSHAGSYRRDTVSFVSLAVENSNARIALRWIYTTSWYAAVIDNIEVFVDNSILAPAQITVDSIGSSFARVSWSPVDSASAYHLVVEGTSIDTSVNSLSCTLSGLNSHTQYSVRVAAIVGTDTGHYAEAQFTTLCGTAPLPYYNNFGQGEASIECWTSANLNQFFQSGYMIIWSGLLAKPSYQTTPIVAHPGNQMVCSFRAMKYGTSSSESGRLIVGAMTNPADTTTFIAIDTFMTTSSVWTEYRFSTHNLDTTPVAIAFCVGTGDGEYCIVAIDDLSIEVPIACAQLLTAEAASVGPTSAMLSWQYDTFGGQSADGVLVDLYDTTTNTSTQFVVHGTDTILTGLPLRHAFRADLRTLCGTDTSEAVTVTFAPEAAVCAEIAGDYDYSAYMFCTPISGDKNYGYSQTLYPAEFAASVDTLYGIALRIGATGESRTLDIYIGQTSADTLISPISVATHTLAAQNYHFQPVSTWTKILFDTPVPIDGVNNLIVTIDDNTGDWLNSMSSYAHYASPGVMLYYNESFYSTVNVDPVALGFNVSRTNKIPDLQLLGHCATERCLQPVIAVEPDSNMLVVSWQQRGSESLWHVEYRREGSNNWHLAGTTAETSYAIYGLNASTPYEVRVGSVCGDSVIYSNSARCYTPCGAVSLPYYHDFTIDNTCWYTHNNYSSSSVGLDLNAGSWPVASPAVSGDISQTAVRFKISGNPNWNPVLKIGVGGSNGENAVWIDSMTLSHSDVQEYTVYLTSYIGNEHHVLFQADDPYARMREVTFEAVGCQAVHHVDISQLTDTSVLLSWPPVNDEGGEWAVYADDSLVAVTTTPSYLLVGLESGTEHTAAVREICNVGDTAEATSVSFTTLCPVQTLPWNDDFESYSTTPAYTTDAVVPCWHTILPAINVSSYVSLVSIGFHNNSQALRFHDHIYVTQHSSDVFIYAASSPINTAGHAAIVQFDLHVERVAQSPDQPFTFQAGIMTDVTDTTTFIPMTIITTPGDTLCSFSTDSLQIPDLFSVAFRFRGDINAYVDNLSVTATPLPMHDLTLAVNDTTMGTVSGGGTYEEGTMVTVTAVPNEGYHFVIWSDSVTEATRQITLRNSDISLTAYFAADTLPTPPPDTVWRIVSLYVTDLGTGSVSGAGTYPDSSLVTISAMPDSGYLFGSWSDGDTNAERTILVTSDTTLWATFYPKVHDTVWYTVNVVRNLDGMIDEFPEGYVSGVGVYAEGDTVTLTLPNYEYGYKCPPYFYGWVLAPGDTIFDLECTFVVTSDTIITAYYRYGVGIDELSILNSQISIYPNPATETVTIEVDQPTTLTIMNATGRECGQWKVERGETTLDISHLPAGAYFIRLAGNSLVRKLIKK